jgi:hypothetical protein
MKKKTEVIDNILLKLTLMDKENWLFFNVWKEL